MLQNILQKREQINLEKNASSDGSGITLTNNKIKDIITGNVINQKGGFLCSLMRVSLPLMRGWLPLRKNVPIPLTRNILLPLGVTDAAIQKKIY